MNPKVVSQKYKDLLKAIDDVEGTECAGNGVLFDTDESIPISIRETTEPLAKRMCNKCPIMYQCLDYALYANETHGIWGGTTPAERIKLRNK